MRAQQKGYFLFRNKKVRIEMITPKRIHFKVVGASDVHQVIYSKEKNLWSCDCKYFTLKSRQCSHIYASKKLLETLQIK